MRHLVSISKFIYPAILASLRWGGKYAYYAPLYTIIIENKQFVEGDVDEIE